jgi:hypothetical protein
MTQELRKLADDLDAEFAQGRISNHNGRKAAAEIRLLLDRVEKAKKDAERCKRFIDAMCEETFDTWTNGYRMQQVAMNIQHAMNITSAMEASK